ncbi:uncharacterized protein STEHIDRAFT_162661 [Stereum hirsutum FP-91666 SS1]|uniref:uncharacterized protein n=1 Tax=Stereum hirsutum (strain FP-91666) TaxID=721885 RepID=UPI0004449CC9|nr:uncharacterized protein STEHIDRAFT_162661 [Stereum hirsutum FP-91666 SS1]EIM80902.1 hypothetical protein STEHIDRAFT_162661 [Stereum hirsutum FP-91666 SS1]
MEGGLKDEVQRTRAEREVLRREHDGARTEWEKDKDALQKEIRNLKEKSREVVSTEEGKELRGQLKRVNSDNWSLRSRLAQIQAVLAKPSTTTSSTLLVETGAAATKNEDVKPTDHQELTASAAVGTSSAKVSSHSQRAHSEDADVIDLTHLEDSPRSKRKRLNSLSREAWLTSQSVSAKRQKTYPHGRVDKTPEFIQGSSQDMLKPSHQPADRAALSNELHVHRLPTAHGQLHGISPRDEPVAHAHRLDGSSDLRTLTNSKSEGSKPSSLWTTAALSSSVAFQAILNDITPDLPSSSKVHVVSI